MHCEITTHRDYLAIGVCAGFLVVLYIFAMIVFIMIKLKQVSCVFWVPFIFAMIFFDVLFYLFS